jgi:hypothetical protein
MANITLRGSLARPLTSAEVDANFSNIKAELDPISGGINSVSQTLNNKTIRDSRIGGGILFDGYLETGGYSSADETVTTLGGANFSSSSSTKLSISAVNSNPGTGDFTVDFWMRSNGASGVTGKVFSFGLDNTANNFQFSVTPQSGGIDVLFALTINNSTVQYLVTSAASNGVNALYFSQASWNYYAISRTNGVVNLYLNDTRLKETGGAAVSTQAGQIGSATAGAGTDIIIGAGSSGNYFSGQLTGFRVNIGLGLYTGDFLTLPNSAPQVLYKANTVYTRLLLLFNRSDNTIVDNSYYSGQNPITNSTPNNVTQSQNEYPFSNWSRGKAGQVLTNTGYGAQWAYISILPAQRSSNSGQVLTTNGTTASWATITSGDVTLTGTQTLSNKTLTSPVLSGTTTSASGNIVFKPFSNILEIQGDGSSVAGQIQLNCHTNAHGQKISAQPHAQAATNTLLLPGGTTIGNTNATLVSDTGTQTLTNKTLTSPTISGTISLATSSNAAGNSTVGGGLFSGSAYATVADDASLRPGTSDFTVEFWMRADSGGTTFNGRVFGKGNYAQSGNLQLEYSGGTSQLLVHINGSFSSYSSPVTMTNGTWYYIAISRVSGTVYVYVNGQRSGNGTSQAGSITNTGAFYVGGSGDNAHFKGNITNFRYIVGTGLYSGATHTVPTTELTAVSGTQLLMLFDNGTSATLQDHSSALRTITNTSVTQASTYIPTTWGSTNAGTSGQVLTSTGTGLQWATPSGGGGGTTTNALTIGTGLSGTSFNGSSAVTIAIDSTVATLTGTQTLTNKTISAGILTGTLTAGGGVGSSGQYLQSTGTGVQWATVASGGTGDVTLTGTQTLTNKTLTSPAISSPTITGTVTAGGGVGANGQVLQSTGTGVVWATVSGGGASLPTQTGNAGKVLGTDGTAASWVADTGVDFDFGGFVQVFTTATAYLLEKIGMDHGTFASPTEPSVNAGTF